MKVYLSKKDNTTKFKVIETGHNTVTVEFLNGTNKGQLTKYSLSTVKRWWKMIEEEEEKPTKKIKKTTNENVALTEEFLNGFSSKYYSSVKCYKFYKNGKPFAEVYPQKKKILCYFKSLDGIDLSKVMFHKEGYKYYLPVRVDISYETNFIEILKELLK